MDFSAIKVPGVSPKGTPPQDPAHPSSESAAPGEEGTPTALNFSRLTLRDPQARSVTPSPSTPEEDLYDSLSDTYDAIEGDEDTPEDTPLDDDEEEPRASISLPGARRFRVPATPNPSPATPPKPQQASTPAPPASLEKPSEKPAVQASAETPSTAGSPKTQSAAPSPAQEATPSQPSASDPLDALLDAFLEEDEGTPAPQESAATPGAPTVKTIPPTPSLDPRSQAVIQDRLEKKASHSKKKRETRERRRLKTSTQETTYRAPRGGLESTYATRSPQEYTVDSQGFPLTLTPTPVKTSQAFANLVEAAEAHSPVAMDAAYAQAHATPFVTPQEQRGQVVYPWTPSPTAGATPQEQATSRKRKLSSQDLEIFRNLSTQKGTFATDETLAASLRTPTARGETSREKALRRARERQATRGNQGLTAGTRGAITTGDHDILTFLTRFRYASPRHLALISGVKEVTTRGRLKKLKQQGLVDSFPVIGNLTVWHATAAGMVFMGQNLPVIREKDFSHVQLSHQFAVNNTAANLMGGNVNVLALPSFPEVRRLDVNGRPVYGETLVSETELNSSFARARQQQQADVYRPRLMAAFQSEFARWEQAGGAAAGLPSPEMLQGNEWMWVLMPPSSLKKKYHVPDLIVQRDRNPDGSPESLAVEIELDSKASYRTTLQAYRQDSRLYKKVIWVCASLQTARALEDTAKEVGLWQEGRIEIVPLITEAGVFTGRDLWRI